MQAPTKADRYYTVAKQEVPTISPRPPTMPIKDDARTGDWVLYHPLYSDGETQQVKVLQYENKTTGDRLVSTLVKMFRGGFDLATRYKHHSPEEALREAEKAGVENLSLQEMRSKGLVMDHKQWLRVGF